MTLEEIEELVERVPSDAPYLKHLASYPGLTSQTNQARVISRNLDAEMDPAFGWKFVRTFVDLHLPFPFDLENQCLRDAYYFEHGMLRSRNLVKALALAAPQHIAARSFVRALLIIPSLTMAQISQKLGLPEETLHFYDQLFFNVRDRLHETLYITSLVYPHGRQVEWRQDYLTMEDVGIIMLRAAFNHGFEHVFEVGGFKSGLLSQFNAQEQAQRLEGQIMSTALYMSSLGGLNHRMVSIENAKNIITSTKLSGQETKSDETIKGLGAISIGQGIIETLQGLQAEDIQKRIYLPPDAKQAALQERFAKT